MKKILLSTIVLIAFSLSIILFEISCKKNAYAQISSYVLPTATTSKLGGVIPDGTTISVDGNGKISTINTSGSTQQNKILYQISNTIWTANYDGTNAQKLNITLPNNLTLDGIGGLSPDRKIIFLDFFSGGTTGTYQQYTYACNIDGSNLDLVLTGTYVSEAF